MKPDGEVRGRIALDYDASRAKPNTWCASERFDSVFIRYFEAAGVEWCGDLVLRYRKVNLVGTFIRPLDSDLTMWATESVVLRDGGARVSFVLGGVPQVIARGMFCEC